MDYLQKCRQMKKPISDAEISKSSQHWESYHFRASRNRGKAKGVAGSSESAGRERRTSLTTGIKV